MREMFRGCSALTELDVSTWIRSIKTKDFYGMFANCVALVKLNAKGLIVSDTGISGTISILQMFRECQSLSQLDISDWTTSDIHEANFAFYHCESLTELDLSTWDVECLRYISHMFDGCKSLSLLNLSNWSEIYRFSEDYHVFTGCVSLELSNIIMENTAYYTVECITNAYNNS
jgi:surface protein